MGEKSIKIGLLTAAPSINSNLAARGRSQCVPGAAVIVTLLGTARYREILRRSVISTGAQRSGEILRDAEPMSKNRYRRNFLLISVIPAL